MNEPDYLEGAKPDDIMTITMHFMLNGSPSSKEVTMQRHDFIRYSMRNYPSCRDLYQAIIHENAAISVKDLTRSIN